MAPYAASKAAVLSLSLSLRAEAALHGVRVSAVCPGYIATGIMDRTRFVGLDRAGLAAAIPVAPLTPEQCARITLRGVARNRAVIPVSRLNRLAREALERALPPLWINGEISNLVRAASGHIYFTLKDERAQVRCTLWRNRAQLLPFRLEQGQEVEVIRFLKQ